MVGQLLVRLASEGVHLWREGDQIRYRAPRPLDHELIESIRRCRIELLDLLATVKPAAAQPAPIVKAPADIVPRCSFAQERFLFVSQLEGPSNSYNLSTAFQIDGELDVRALELGICDLVERHNVLRSAFEPASGSFAITLTGWKPKLRIVELTTGTAELVEQIELERARPFDVMRGPHLRTTIFRESALRHTLLITMHHIVSDGGSIAVLSKELEALYAWRIGKIEMPPLPQFQYTDFAYSERLELDRSADQEDLAFWKKDLATAPTLHGVATDHPRRATRSHLGGSVPIRLDESLQHRLNVARSSTRLSHFQLSTSALALLLYKYSAQRSIVIGTPSQNRTRPGSEGIIGPLLNLLPIHLRIDPAGTVRDLMDEVRSRTLAAVEHGSVPFERIVSMVSPDRSAGYTPIFQVMCAVEDTPPDLARLSGLDVEQLDLPNETLRYDLALILQSKRSELHGLLKYDRSLFDRQTAVRLARHFEAALRIVIGDPDLPLARAGLLTEDEKKLQLVTWNSCTRPYPLHKTIIDLFEETVARVPHRAAVEFEGRSLTYEDLNGGANQLAHRLCEMGIVRDDVVALVLDRSLEMTTGILGILKAGAAYTPIDPGYPRERQTWLIDDARAKAVIGLDRKIPTSLPFVQIDGIELRQYPLGNPARRSSPDAACYLMYTSGSTGQPKGVINDHRGIANNLLWMNDEWPLGEDDAVLFKASPSFDVSVKEIMWPLIAGARLVVARPGGQADPEYICETIRNRRVTVVHMVPTMLEYFLRHEAASRLPYLRIVMCGGEALSPVLRIRFHQASDAILLHLYGPTEAAVAVTGYAISSEHADVERLPLGKPMPNCQIYIVDDALEPVPIGVAGELCIAGIPLARGYLARPDLTAEKFVPNPFGTAAEPRMYRTGDLARWRADGQIEYLGRIDRQVKVRGYRIEPGEIEAAIRKHPGVEEALVLAGESDSPDPLVAYLVGPDDLPTRDIEQALRARFPAFMVPRSFVVVRALPTGSNGKLDLSALPPVRSAPAQGLGGPPQGDLEKRIAAIWCELLNIESVGRDENFFDLGGHSLLILQLRDRLRTRLGHSVPLTELFLQPTVAGVATQFNATIFRRAGGWLKRMIPRTASVFGS